MINKILSKYFDTDSSELLSKSISFMIIRILGTIITFSFTFYVTSKYGADIYGLIALGFSVFLVVSVIGRLGLDIHIVKFFSLQKSNEDSGLFLISLLKSFLVTGLISLLIFWQNDFIVNEIFKEPKPELIPYLNWILPAIPFWSTTLLCANFLRSKKMNNWFVFFTSSSRFTFALIILLVIASYFSDPLIVVQAHFFSVLIISILSFLIAISRFDTLKLKSKTSSWRFLKESLPIMYSSSINVLLNWIGVFILGAYTSNKEVGIFEIAVKLAFLLNFFLQALNSILAPKIAEKYNSGNIEGCQKMIKLSTKINFLISLSTSVVLIIFNQYILGIFGNEFKAAYVMFILLCLGQLVSAFSGSVGIILQMTGKQVIYQYLMILALAVSVIFMFILVPTYGGEGAAVASLLSMMTWNFLGLIYIKRKMNLKSYFHI